MSNFLSLRAGDGFTITPHNDNDLAVHAAAIYVGVVGDVKIITAKGTTLTFKAVPGGTIIPIDTARVLATGTDATFLVGLTL